MKFIYALLFMCCIVVSCIGREYIVYLHHCPSSSINCLTLEDFNNQSDVYFKSHHTFILLQGNHYLSTTLTLQSITNLTLEGVNATASVLWAIGSIQVFNSSEVMIKNIIIRHNNRDSSVYSFLEIEYSSFVCLQDIHFFKNNYEDTLSRAANIFNSSITIINCSFYGGYSDEGGALKIDSSMVNYFGNISFDYNRATSRGASLLTTNSKLIFNGNVSFDYNKIFPDRDFEEGEGGAIYASNSIIKFKCLSRQVDYYNKSLFLKDIFLTTQNCSVQFVINSGENGGAIYSEYSKFFFEGKTYIIGNTGADGGAIYSYNSKFFFCHIETNILFNSAFFDGGAIYAFNSNVSFYGNVLLENNEATYYGGGIYVFYSTVETSLNLTFYLNSADIGGGIHSFRSVFIVSGTFKFIHNEADISGGGMSLETSDLFIDPPVQFGFYHNKAKKGGAISYEDPMLYTERCVRGIYKTINCFIKFLSNNTISLIGVSFIFHKNTAVTGSDIFGGNLDTCRIHYSDEFPKIRGWNFLMMVSTFNHTKYDNSSISSYPLGVCFCEHGIPKCSRRKGITLSIPHGRIFKLSVLAVGQNHSPVPSEILHSFVSSTKDAQLHRLTSVYDDTSTSCQSIAFKLLSSNKREKIKIYPAQCKSSSTETEVSIEFQSCPPGFQLYYTSCECESRLKGVIHDKTSCDIETGLIRHPGEIWLKPLKDENLTYEGFMWTEKCPNLFCNASNSNISLLLNFSSSDVDSQCLSHRTGIMCGSCKENFSLTLNSLECHACDNSFITLTIVFLLAGIVLIVVLLSLHISVASGTINGLILYVNIVNISKDIFFPPHQPNGYFLTIFIAWINLDFGVSTCFFKGLDFYTYTWLQFVFPFYLWILVGIIIVSSRLSSKLARLFGSNPVAVLATIILMSYTKLLHTSHSALAFTIIKYSNETEEKVWKLDPSISYFSTKHIPLAVFSIVVLTFLIIPYTFALLLGYHLQAHSHKRRFFWINKLKPLLDSYYAPFQKHTRFWTGFMLVVRTCLYITYIITEENDRYAILIAESSVFAAISVIPWLRIHIYENKYFEILEVSYVFNILILAIGTYHIRSKNSDNLALSLISVGVAFTEFIGIIAFHIIVHLSHRQGKTLSNIWNIISKSCMKKVIENSTQQGAPEELAGDININFTSTTISIREPLLEEKNSQL